MNTYRIEASMNDNSVETFAFHHETDELAISDAVDWINESLKPPNPMVPCRRISAEYAELTCVSGVGISAIHERLVALFSVKNREIITKRG